MKKLLALVALITFGGLLAIAPAGADGHDARIHLIHGIPGVDVDVEIAGEVAIPGFSFQDTQDLSDFAGQTLADVQVKVAGTDDVAIDIGDLELPATGNITAIAHLDADGTPTVSIFSNDVSTIDAGSGRLVVRHTAAAPEVDILANGDVAFAAVPNGAEGSVDLPAGTISASVVPAGETEPVVIGPADLPIEEGTSLIVYAVGSLADENLSVITETITGLDGNPGPVHTGNFPVDESNRTLPLVGAGLAVLLAAAAVLGLVRRPATVNS